MGQSNNPGSKVRKDAWIPERIAHHETFPESPAFIPT